MFGRGGMLPASAAVLSGCVLAALSAWMPAVHADEAATRQAVSKLLEIGWNQSAQARAATDAQSQAALQVAGRDSRALTAAWLVLIQQRRFEEALKRADEHLEAAPDDVLALRAKAWLHTILKNYPAAMLSAE